MRVLWFLTTVLFSLQFGLTRTFQSIENNRDSGNEKTVTVPIILDNGGVHYADIGIGTPPQRFSVFFETWNQNTWITSTKCPTDKYPMCKTLNRYDATKSSSSKQTQEEFSYTDRSTTLNGTITEDTVTLGGKKLSMRFGEVNAAVGYDLDTSRFDGIFGIGIGPTPIGGSPILESLKKSGLIDKKVFGMWLKSNYSGEIMFGGYNKNLYSGEIDFTDVLSEEWMFGVKSIKFGEEDLTGEDCQALVTTGLLPSYGPREQVDKIRKVIGCKPSEFCEVNCSKINTFPDLKIIVSKTEFTIKPRDYISKHGDECTFNIFYSPRTAWWFGNLFLDKMYIAYDTEQSKIGFALASEPGSTLSPTPRSTTTKPTVSTTEVPTTSTEEPTTSTSTEEQTTPTTQGPQPTTTRAGSTLFLLITYVRNLF